jgi:hypothetical protein
MKVTSLFHIVAALWSVAFTQREECHNALSRNKQIDAQRHRESVANALQKVETMRFDNPYTGKAEHDRVEEANASLFDNANFSEGLTTFALGIPSDGDALRVAREAIAPMVPVGRRFEYYSHNKGELLETDADDERAVGSDFKELSFHGTIVQDKLANRGLTVTVDEDEVGAIPNWDQLYTQRLIDRMDRNGLVRDIALVDAAATNTARTWDTTAGKDPDADIKADLLLTGDGGGLQGNRVIFGEAAWTKRFLSHRAQTGAGGFASAGLTEDQVAALLGVDMVAVIKSRATSGSTFPQIAGSKVFSYFALSGQMAEDASNIKRFYGNVEGAPYRVYKYRVGAKLWKITVERYERTRITSLAGMRKSTIS